MRWFRRPNQDSDAPRLISLSPLALEQQQQQTTTESSGWTFNRFAAPAAPLTDPADATHVPSAHLPCTLKRKPAVRRRSGGKGQHTLSIVFMDATKSAVVSTFFGGIIPRLWGSRWEVEREKHQQVSGRVGVLLTSIDCCWRVLQLCFWLREDRIERSAASSRKLTAGAEAVVRFREFAAERSIRSGWTQKPFCRAFQELSIDMYLS